MTENSIRQYGETPENSKFLLLKTEKLSVAIHIVTGHLSGREPLREELRRMSLRLVEDVRELIYGEQESLLSDTSHLEKVAGSIVSSLYVAKSAKIIGQGNVSVLEREYLELGNYFTKSMPEQEILPTRELPAKKISIGHEISKGHKSSERVKSSHNPPEGLSRKESILNIIEGRNSYSLGDIVSKIKGISEKTIQRDLLGLVSRKVLKKIGERRWSRYMRA
ncbi:MAG: hypothetical protein WC764_03105 [Candidatus Paceibacterota bacterium]|jgi:hypothetical protein